MAIRNSLKEVLKGQDVSHDKFELKARTRSSGTNVSISDLPRHNIVTLEDFQKDEGVLLVDFAPPARRQGDRLAALEKKWKQHFQMIRAPELDHAILRASVKEFPRVLRRSLVKAALEVLVGAFPRNEDEPWRQYLKRLTSDIGMGTDWLEGQGLPVDVFWSLLPKNAGTPYDKACMAAHDLLWNHPEIFEASYLKGVEEDEEEEADWKVLYSFVMGKPKPKAKAS